MRKYKYIIIHHSVTPESYTVDQIRNIHLSIGYADVGYHYLITKNGLKVGRDINRRGAHAIPDFPPYNTQDMNSVSIGICIIGTFTNYPPSTKIINETAYAIKRIAKKYGIPIDKDHILGHSQVSRTACPGQYTMSCIYEKLGLKPYQHRSQDAVRNIQPEEIKEEKSMIKDFIKLLFLLMALIIGNEEPGNGAEKKQKVIEAVYKCMSDFGIKFPGWLQKFIDSIMGFLVDLLVKYLNKNGFLDLNK